MKIQKRLALPGVIGKTLNGKEFDSNKGVCPFCGATLYMEQLTLATDEPSRIILACPDCQAVMSVRVKSVRTYEA